MIAEDEAEDLYRMYVLTIPGGGKTSDIRKLPHFPQSLFMGRLRAHSQQLGLYPALVTDLNRYYPHRHRSSYTLKRQNL